MLLKLQGRWLTEIGSKFAKFEQRNSKKWQDTSPNCSQAVIDLNLSPSVHFLFFIPRSFVFVIIVFFHICQRFWLNHNGDTCRRWPFPMQLCMSHFWNRLATGTKGERLEWTDIRTYGDCPKISSPRNRHSEPKKKFSRPLAKPAKNFCGLCVGKYVAKNKT